MEEIVRTHFYKEAEIECIKLLKRKELALEGYSKYLDELVNKKEQIYLKRRGGLDKIKLSRDKLKTSFETVKKSFLDAQDLEYFQKREKIKPAMKSFYELLRSDYEDIEFSWEYDGFLKQIEDIASIGTRYPFVEEINHGISKNEPEKILDTLISQIRTQICVDGDKGYSFCGKCADCQTLLNEKLRDNTEISNQSFSTQTDFKFPYYHHVFNVIKINKKRFIVDPTYVQFCDLSKIPDIVEVPGCIGANPGQYLMDTPKKREFLHGLIRNGYFEITPETLKMYFDSFVLANRSSNFYKEHPETSKMQTEFKPSDYVEMLLGKKTLDIGVEKSKTSKTQKFQLEL